MHRTSLIFITGITILIGSSFALAMELPSLCAPRHAQQPTNKKWEKLSNRIYFRAVGQNRFCKSEECVQDRKKERDEKEKEERQTRDNTVQKKRPKNKGIYVDAKQDGQRYRFCFARRILAAPITDIDRYSELGRKVLNRTRAFVSIGKNHYCDYDNGVFRIFEKIISCESIEEESWSSTEIASSEEESSYS